jgi:hypothetical protein
VKELLPIGDKRSRINTGDKEQSKTGDQWDKNVVIHFNSPYEL